VFGVYLHYSFVPGVMEPKSSRPARGIGPLMIAIATAQELRLHLSDACMGGDSLTTRIAAWIAEIERFFVKPDLKCVMESVAPNGDLLDHFDGRTLNPGHSIEAAWFVLHEYRVTRRAELLPLGLNMLEWMFERGWDREHGGLLYFVDVFGKPVAEYWHHQKFWWPHNEAVIAALLAYKLTGDEKYARMHKLVHEYTYARFPDGDKEWFGYLDRQGTPTTMLKGNMFKGPFHVPRMMMYCRELLDANL
jgi:N-acylglucosamine 2-epimerase